MGNSIEWESYLACACGWVCLCATQEIPSKYGVRIGKYNDVTKRGLYSKEIEQRAMDLRVRVEEGVDRELRDDDH